MLLAPLPPVVFFGGKGGVGKTTLAAATAAGFASRGEKTLLISTDPAHSLGDLLDTRLGDSPTAVAPNLWVRELDPDTARKRYLQTVKDNIRSFAAPEFRQEAERQVDLSGLHPGVMESAVFEALCRQLDDADQWDRLIVDTAPTGHTLYLLTLPESMQAWTDALIQRQSVQPTAQAPEGAERWRKARETLEARRSLFERSRNKLQDAQQAGFVLVINDDRLSVREGVRAWETLHTAGVAIPAVLVNRAEQEADAIKERLAGQFPQRPLLILPARHPAPQGLAGLQGLAQTLATHGFFS